jgi:hypothetical protein
VKDLGQYLDDGIDKRLNNNFNKILNLVSNKNFSGGDLINLLRDRSLEKIKKINSNMFEINNFKFYKKNSKIFNLGNFDSNILEENEKDKNILNEKENSKSNPIEYSNSESKVIDFIYKKLKKK